MQSTVCIEPLTNQQSAFPHHAGQSPLAIDHQPLMPPQPPDHPAIAIRRLLATGQDHFLILRTVGTAASPVPLIVEAGPADRQHLFGHQLHFFSSGHRFHADNGPARSSLAQHVLRSRSAKWERPSARSSCLIRFSCSASGCAAALLPQAQPWLCIIRMERRHVIRSPLGAFQTEWWTATK